MFPVLLGSESQSPPAHGRKLHWVIILFLLFTLLFAGSYVVLRTYIAKWIAEQITIELGLDVSIKAIKGTYFSSLELIDIKTLGGSPKTIVTSVDLDRLVFRYSLPSLLTSVDSFLATASISLNNGDCQLDISSEKNDQQKPTPDAGFVLPHILPHISAENVSVRINTPQGMFEFAGLSVTSDDIQKEQADTYAVDIKIQQAKLAVPSLKKEAFPISLRLQYSPKEVAVTDLFFDKEKVADILHLDLADYQVGRIPFKADLLLFDGSVQLKGLIEESRITGELEISNVKLKHPPAFLAKPEQPLAGIISGRTDMSVDLADPSKIKGNLDFTLHAGEMHGVAVDRAVLMASAANGILSIEQFAVTFGESLFSLEDVAFAAEPLMDVDIKKLLAEAKGRFSLITDAVPQLLALAGVPEGTMVGKGKFPPHKLHLAGQIQKGKVIFSDGELSTDTSSLVLGQGIITLPPSGSSFEGTMIQSDLTFRFASLDQLAELFDLPTMMGSLQGQLNLNGTTADLKGSLAMQGKDLEIADWQLGSLQTMAKYAAGSITVESLLLEQEQNKANGSGSFRIADNYIEKLNLHLAVKDPTSLPADIFVDKLSRQGEITVILEAAGPLSEPEFKVEAQLAGGQYDGIDISQGTVSLTNKGRLLTIREAQIISGEREVILAGTLLRGMNDERFDIILNSLNLRQNQAEIGLLSPVSLSIEKTTGSVHLDSLVLSGNVGRIEASGVLHKTGNSDFKAAITGLTSKDWIDVFTGHHLYFNGADVILHIQGDSLSPVITLDGTIKEIGNREAPFPFAGSFSLSYKDQQLHFHRFSLAGFEGRGTAEISGRLPFSLFAGEFLPTGAVDLAARFQLPDLQVISEVLPEQYLVKGSMKADILLQGTWAHPSGSVQLDAEDLILPATWKFIPPESYNLNCDIKVSREQIFFETMRLKSKPFSFTVSGKWLNPPTLDNIIDDQARFDSGSLDLAGNLEMSDITWAAKNIEAIRRLEGRITAEISATGPASNPAITGTIHLTDGELRPSYEMSSFREMSLEAKIDSNQIIISNFKGELGGAPFSASGEVTDYRSTDPQVDFVLQGENILLYRNSDMRVRSNIDAKIHGPVNKLNISGDLIISDGRFTGNFDFLSLFRRGREEENKISMQLFSIMDPPLNNANFQVRVSAKTAFFIKNNLANGSVRPAFMLAGTGEVPVIFGNIYLDPIKIKIPAGIINIESGLIRFIETDPDRPQIDVTGKTRIMGYDIILLIQGPADEPTVTLSSSPPLPDDDLLLLLLTGKIPKGISDKDSVWQGGMNIAIYLGRDILGKWFNATGSESDASILDRFEVEIGRGVTRLGDQTVEGQLRLAEGVFRNDDILFITAEKDIYDAYNAGVKIVFRFQ